MRQSHLNICSHLLPALLLGALFWGCSRAYYGALEKVGIPKRDLFTHRVEKARDAQQDTKEQFESAFEEFKQLVEFQGGSLGKVYEKLNAEFHNSEEEASQLRERIDAVEDVAGALFDEWEKELKQYTDASLKRESRAKLRETRKFYGELMQGMHRAEERVDPVLNVFRDQVLYLKHNLNARAIASLQGEVGRIRKQVDRLVADMNQAIEEANQFLVRMEAGSAT